MSELTGQATDRPILPAMDQPAPKSRERRDDRGPIAPQPEAFVAAVEAQINAGHTARYNELAATLFEVHTRTEAERSAVADALGALHDRMLTESLDGLRAKVAVVAASAADDKGARIVDLIRSALVAPCPAWCVVDHEDDGSHGFSAMHESEPVTVTQEHENRGLVPTAVVEVRAYRMDQAGRSGQAVVDVRTVSEFAELSPDTVVRLADALMSVKTLADADRAAVSCGA
jgi:hypothetical protein